MAFKGNFPQMARETGFRLRQYLDGPLDWRLMGSYETDRILREQNFELVDKALAHLSEAPLGTVLETHILDSGIAKYFVMSQYAIQYLLCCRTYLDECVSDLREAHTAAQQEIVTLRKSLGESNNEVLQLNKRITQIEAIREVVYPCHLCTKNFISNEALNMHIGRRHRVATPPSPTSAGGKDKDKENDLQLINTIKMELEIKQLKERLNAAERNIKERSTGGSKRVTPRLEQRNVGIQSNLAEQKEKEDISEGARDSEASERKEQLTGITERLSHFEEWQLQLKQSNEEFIQDINKKLEGLSRALEQNQQTSANAPPLEDRVATPNLDDLERILTEKVAEIGKISANKLEEVVFHLEMGYKEKLDALERELKQLSVQKEQPEPVKIIPAPASKIPKPVVQKEESSIDRIRKQVENEFVKKKHDDDTYSIEEVPPENPKIQQMTQVQVHVREKDKDKELPSAGSSGSHPTFTKPVEYPVSNNPETRETTDISESLSQEEEVHNVGDQSLSDDPTELSTSGSEAPRLPEDKPKAIKPPVKIIRTPQKPLTRKDARKMVNRKLSPLGFDMKSKGISHTSLKRVSAELAEQRNKLKLNYPHFYATRNRIRKFVEKLCSAKLSEHAEVLLKHKTPLKPIEVPKRRMLKSRTPEKTEEDLSTHTSEDDVGKDEDDRTEGSEGSQSQSPSPAPRSIGRDFKARLEEILVKPVATTRGTSKPAMPAKPVPVPRKRVMFNTLDSGKSFNESDEDFK
ncbi:hypothetical protein KR018_010923 [Drosophila ironensis]|nr:hypothetical protein KR018_010923 [Drosophila ironensis]